MADIVGAIVNVVNCICSAPTCSYVDAHINFEDNVEELKRILGDLNNRKQDIESRIPKVHPGQLVRCEVQGWCQNVQNINADVQAVLEKVQRVRWYKRAYIDKLVCRKIIAVKAIYEQGGFTEGLVIDIASADQGISIPADNLVGQTSSKAKILEYLMGNEVRKIGVVGIGGVGKTTIMKHANNELLRLNMFHKVIWVTVSYPLNIFELQKNIASAMGGRLPEDEKNQIKWAAELMKIMGRVRCVLILDDVWEMFSLTDVGIPEPTKDNGCKLVVTSRKEDVCNYLDCKIVKVQCLSAEESLNLFLDKVGRDVLQVPKLEETLKLIVQECAGLPLAIVVIAGSMKGEYDIHVWRDSLNKLRECVKKVKGPEDEIFERLRFSYDRLQNPEVQHCFLYCSLFKEDHVFSKRQLIEDWIDEGLIDKLGSRQAAYDRGHAFLKMLEKNCLLEKAPYMLADERVKMHDVLRDMAIKIIGPEVGYMSKAGRKLSVLPAWSEWGNNLKKMSLAMNKISKIPSGLSLECSTLTTLILSSNPLQEIPESFFKNMSGLKVLDLSETEIVALPSSFSELENLTALRLCSCKRLECLPSLGKLGGLKKLDLEFAGIREVPQGLEKLTSLEYLNLFCENLKGLPTGILPNLSCLQYFCLYDEPSTALRIEGKEVKEIARLSKLETLVCRFSDIQDFNSFSKFEAFQSLKDYRLSVGSRRSMVEIKFSSRRGITCVCTYSCLEKNVDFIQLSDCNIGEGCMVLPNNLRTLWISGCDNVRSSLNKTVLLEKTTGLEICVIEDCEDIECVFDLDPSSCSLCCSVLLSLNDLYLKKLPRLGALVRVVEGIATPPGIFSNLKRLWIDYCSGIRKLLPLELLQALQNLVEIRVCNCEQMEEIIESADASDKFSFPKLRKLYFSNLPQLKSLCNGKGVVVCDSIEEIHIRRCPELKRIPMQLPLDHNGQPSPPPRLRGILIDEDSKEWWESVVEWDHPNTKNLLQPFMRVRC